MNAQSIEKLQKQYNKVHEMQKMINSGQVWHMEGSMGRFAMDLLRSGVCMLPTHTVRDYYGSVVPSRHNVKPGTAGSYQNCIDFWQSVVDENYADDPTFFLHYL